MRNQILISVIVITIGCTNTNSSNNEGVIEKFDSLIKEPVYEGYVPEQKIDFSHQIHAEQKLTKDCYYCHKKPNTKVELNLCAKCHNFNMKEMDKLNYYVQLDSISTKIRKLNK